MAMGGEVARREGVGIAHHVNACDATVSVGGGGHHKGIVLIARLVICTFPNSNGLLVLASTLASYST